MLWSCPLDSKRGRAVNQNTNKAWFDLLEGVLEKYDIAEDCIYAADEIGISPQSGEDERVIGSRKPGPQYQQRTGSKENTTVIVTICADGTSSAPAVIFKGNAYQVNIGYSKKGWTDGEIGIEWIKDFDKRTKAKADGCDRLLVVDGHNSHYTRGFLQYARAHRIHVICYPAHATHVYQGLDVVVFAGLKQYWSDERDKWEREKGDGITKSNFLTIYGRAHLRALKPGIIRTAFRKTGVWPFNRDVVTDEMMAPSKETSCEGHLPIRPSTPVR
ncbi:DDE-domain-containing protein, partial [Leucogyrophana mollusca]